MSADLSTLTTGEFLHALRQVVAEKGAGYVYPKSGKRAAAGDLAPVCQYRVNGGPSCIIGHVLDRLGIVTEPRHEGCEASHVIALYGGSEQVAALADAAQVVQDGGDTWGDALAEVEHLAEFLGAP